jgi:hypothetical protein
MSTVQFVSLLGVGIANLVATVTIAKLAFDAKRSSEAEISDLKKKTNKTISKMAATLADLEV